MARAKNSSAQRHIEKLELEQKKLDAGTVAERYPQVSGIVILLTYYQNLPNPVLMSRTVNFFPESPAYFHMKCAVRECEGGGFELSPAVASLVRHRKRIGKGKMNCKGRGEGITARHASVAYEIKIAYHKGS